MGSSTIKLVSSGLYSGNWSRNNILKEEREITRLHVLLGYPMAYNSRTPPDPSHNL